MTRGAKIGVAVAAAPFVGLLGLGMMFNAQLGMTQTTGGQPSQLARADIPALYYLHYRQAGDKYGIDWAVLAAIGKVETDHGRLNAPGVTTGVNSYGCCAGPMQFMVTPRPSTWDAYGQDGNVYDPRDAIPAAARYLKAAGAPDDYQRAIFAYNHAGWYVTKVLDQAAAYRAAPEIPAGGAVAGSPKQIIDTVVLPIARSCGVPATVAANDAANERHKPLTSSGYPSDHKGPPDQAWAADMSNGGSPTPEMDCLAEKLAARFGYGSKWGGSGLVDHIRDGMRFQLIWRAPEHYNHVHFGIKRVAGPAF